MDTILQKQLNTKLQELLLKKARIFANIESLSEVNDKLFTQLGKVQSEIMFLKKEINSLIVVPFSI
jgi:peptidoglycan hydrolase CwlO-like protein